MYPLAGRHSEPGEFISARQPQQVRITRADGSKFVLQRPTVLGDSLVGTVGGGMAPQDSARTAGILLTDVQRVEFKKTSVGKTVGLVAVVAVAAVGFMAMAECKGGFETPDCP
jgi:hypothetical protein